MSLSQGGLRMRPCIIVLVLGTVLATGVYAESWPSQIGQYYKDVSYVAVHSIQNEQRIMLAYMSGRVADNSFLKDRRLRPVYERLQSIMAVRLHVDGGIFKGPFGYDASDCSSTAEPTQLISQSADKVVIRVDRKSVAPIITPSSIVSFIKRLLHPPWYQGGWSYDQVDTWLLVDGKWRLFDVHIFPIVLAKK
jgi:hypothetical protein